MSSLGIMTGRFNHSATGIATIGWKGGASSVRWFADLALAVELGVTSEIFPRKREPIAGCLLNGLPEDRPRLTRRLPNTASAAADYAAVGEGATGFVRALAPPTRQTSYTSAVVGSVTSGMITNGQAKFIEVGCVACHTQNHTTGNSALTGQTGVTYEDWTDRALHNMGSLLRDGLSFGAAGPQDFRTPALWGSGQRHFFLHDGRAADLNEAIQAHKSIGSEASATVDLFNTLSTPDQQDVLNFLRAL
jgi:CxxC motif-containing protein (DUF1111 family)